jgi:hypothetical protein
MNLNQLPGKLSRLIAGNSPVILTAIGVAGVATTAFLTHKASRKHERLILDTSPWMSKKDEFLKVWKLYIPAAGVGVMTCTCIVLANRIGTRRAAVVAAVATMTERAFTEYRDEIVETIGDKKEELVRAGVAKKKLEKSQPTDSTIIITDGGEMWIMESFTGRVFKGDKETIRKAENDINAHIYINDYATLSMFYDKIKIPHTDSSDDIGWNQADRLVLDWSTTEYDGKPVMVFDYGVRPFLRPDHYI